MSKETKYLKSLFPRMKTKRSFPFKKTYEITSEDYAGTNFRDAYEYAKCMLDLDRGEITMTSIANNFALGNTFVEKEVSLLTRVHDVCTQQLPAFKKKHRSIVFYISVYCEEKHSLTFRKEFAKRGFIMVGTCQMSVTDVNMIFALLDKGEYLTAKNAIIYDTKYDSTRERIYSIMSGEKAPSVKYDYDNFINYCGTLTYMYTVLNYNVSEIAELIGYKPATTHKYINSYILEKDNYLASLAMVFRYDRYSNRLRDVVSLVVDDVYTAKLNL